MNGISAEPNKDGKILIDNWNYDTNKLMRFLLLAINRTIELADIGHMMN